MRGAGDEGDPGEGEFDDLYICVYPLFSYFDSPTCALLVQVARMEYIWAKEKEK